MLGFSQKALRDFTSTRGALGKMAAVVCRISKSTILNKATSNVVHIPQAGIATAFRNTSFGRKVFVATTGLIGGGAAGLIYALNQTVRADATALHPPEHPWSHNGPFSSLDHASIRRGYEVYKQVCAACHSMRFKSYRQLVGVCHTEAEAKAEAAEILVRDGPDDEGNMFDRPGILSDRFPAPYPNDEAARAANNGALPPDLSLITLARHGGEDYIFALLTGYCDPPAGIEIKEGLYYNPYFPDGSIGMAQALYNEAIEYSDGTPATTAQLAKDVSTFLKWSAEPEHDWRKKTYLKILMVFSIFIPIAVYLKRLNWASMKSRKIAFRPVPRK